jgi:hypothetical protein
MSNREIQSFEEDLDSVLPRASETATDLVKRTGFE